MSLLQRWSVIVHFAVVFGFAARMHKPVIPSPTPEKPRDGTGVRRPHGRHFGAQRKGGKKRGGASRLAAPSVEVSCVCHLCVTLERSEEEISEGSVFVQHCIAELSEEECSCV